MKHFITIALLLFVQQFIACGNPKMSIDSPRSDHNASTTEKKFSKNNRAPIAISQTIHVRENSSVKIELFGFDEQGEKVISKIVSQPMHGSYNNHIYRPDADYSGIDSFKFTVTDGSLTSEPGTITIMVKKEESLLDTSKEIIVPKGASKRVVLGDENYTYTLLSKPKNGKLSGPMPYITYRPNDDFAGSDSFTYRVGDDLNKTVKLKIKEFKVVSRTIHIDSQIEKILRTYDKYGNLLKKDFITNKDGMYGTGELKKRNECTCKYLYTYNEQGRVLTKATYIIDKNGSSILSDSEKRFYDADNQLHSKIETKNIRGVNYSIVTTYTSKGDIDTKKIVNIDTNYEKSTIFFTYDEEGRLVDKTVKEPDGKVKSSYTYTYDANGNPLMKYPHIYTYDVNGNILTDSYAPWNKVENMHSYTYDQYGNVLRETFYDSPSTDQIAYVKTYTYDSHGNKVREDEKNEDNNTNTYYTYKYDEFGNITTIYEKPYKTFKSYDKYGNIETIIDTLNGLVLYYHKYQWKKFEDEP